MYNYFLGPWRCVLTQVKHKLTVEVLLSLCEIGWCDVLTVDACVYHKLTVEVLLSLCEIGWCDVLTVDACVYPYGSTVSNFALVDSDLNIDVEVKEPAQFLSELLRVLRDDKTGVDCWW